MEFETAYENTYGTIEEVPVFGLTAAKVLPIFILVFMLLNITNFYAKFMSCFGLEIFTFGTGIYDEAKSKEGKQLIERARNKKEKEKEQKNDHYREMKKVIQD